jgi:hypothetical protein
MPEDFSEIRKRILMGTSYEVPVQLADYGGIEARVRALSELTLTKIEESTGVRAIDVIKSTEKLRETIQPGDSETTVAEKFLRSFTPEYVRFLAELAIAGLVVEPDPSCSCGGRDPACEKCSSRALVNAMRGTTVIQLGMAVLEATFADWATVESFFSQQRVPS